MTQTSYLWNPPPVRSVPVRGKNERYPINRLFFVGRNYHAHAVEMGRPADKSVEVPFYFTKAAMSVNGQTRQKSDIDKLIWNIRELIADLSQYYHLEPGDLIYTGTPEGVGPVVPGDRLDGHVAGAGTIALQVGAAD